MGGNSAVDATRSDSARDDADNRIVLIAEDEEPISEAIAVIVEEVGFKPLLAANGQEALELALTYHPELVITDLMMPRMDGIRLMTELRIAARIDGHSAPPVVLMSAAGVRKVQDAGADAILRKPFDIDDLERLLIQFLGPADKH
jgi:DNA-binding response OmpR family regulator